MGCAPFPLFSEKSANSIMTLTACFGNNAGKCEENPTTPPLIDVLNGCCSLYNAWRSQGSFCCVFPETYATEAPKILDLVRIELLTFSFIPLHFCPPCSLHGLKSPRWDYVMFGQP